MQWLVDGVNVMMDRMNDMSDIKRFNPEVEDTGIHKGIPYMHQVPQGEYVEYIEYLKLYNKALVPSESAEVKELKAKIRSLKCALRDATDELDEVNGY